MPPYFLIFLAAIAYAPVFGLILAAATVLRFSGSYKQYSMPIVAVYFMFPAAMALATMATIPVLMLCIGSVYLSENHLSSKAAVPVNISSFLLLAAFFVCASYKSVSMLCPFAWHWAKQKWPNGIFNRAF